MTAVAPGDRLDAWLDVDDQPQVFPVPVDVVRAEPGVVIGSAIDGLAAHVLFPTTGPEMSATTHVHIATGFHAAGDDPEARRTFPTNQDWTQQ